jgi:hypothetical protein
MLETTTNAVAEVWINCSPVDQVEAGWHVDVSGDQECRAAWG